jgi:hypothetical protein
MSIRYSDRPQLNYTGQRAADDWRNRFPSNAQSIATAPSNTARAVWVFEPDGKRHAAIHHRGQWQKISRFHDNRTGTTQWRMTGEAVANPIAWASS